MSMFQKMDRFYMEEVRPVRLKDQKAPHVEQIFPNELCERITELPYGSGSPLSFDNEIWYEFCETLSLASDFEDYLDSEIFGICEIEVKNNFKLNAYPIPVVHPTRKSYSKAGEIRFFSFATKSGDDLISTLRGPLTPDKRTRPYFIYSFDMKEKKWYRIMSVLEDGSYVRVPIPSEMKHGDYPPESDDNTFLTCYGELLIWSIGDRKIRAEVDDQATDDFGFPIGCQRADIKKYWEDISVSNKDINSETYVCGGIVRRSLLIQKPLTDGFRTEYRIVALLNYIARKVPYVKEQRGGEVDYRHNGSVLFYQDSRKKLGVFMGYSARIPLWDEKGTRLGYSDDPPLWNKGSLFVFDVSSL